MKRTQEPSRSEEIQASGVLNGDLYVIGRLWVQGMKAVLVGTSVAVIPVVHAAKPPPEPTYPPPMRYKDLPLYQSPHYEYKDHEEDKLRCPKANIPLIQEYLLPSVRTFRKDTQRSVCQMRCGCKGAYAQLKKEMAENERAIKTYFRDPDKLTMRRGLVSLGILTGYLVARRRGIPSRIFGATCGGFLAGALTFPVESDRAMREILYRCGQLVVAVYNFICSDNYVLEERLSCREDMPPPPPPRKSQCPIK